MTTQELEKIISELIAAKSCGTPQDIAAALAINPKVIKDIASLEQLKRVKTFDQISLSNEEQSGSVRFHSFKPDFSCMGSGYGYSNIVEDFREGFWATCGSPSATTCLRVCVG